MTWSVPYCGVSHLADSKPYQVTCEQFASFTNWYVLVLSGDHPFTPLREGTATSLEQARTDAEAAYAAISGRNTQ